MRSRAASPSGSAAPGDNVEHRKETLTRGVAVGEGLLDAPAAGLVSALEVALGNAGGASNYVRVEALTPVGVLDRDKKLGVVKEMTEIVAAAAGDPSLAERTWVLISEAPDGGWEIDGHAYTNAEIAATARRQLTR